jgi:DNA topoisomerase-3
LNSGSKQKDLLTTAGLFFTKKQKKTMTILRICYILIWKGDTLPMIGILCEKPSAGRNFAAALGGKEGTYNGEKYKIVTSHGHLYGLDSDPSKQVDKVLEEQYKSWEPTYLPWNESDLRWKYTALESPKNAKFESVNETLKKIKDALSGCDEVCIATDDDPSGEGDLLATEILLQQKIKAPKYTRMYFADEAPKSIQKAFKTRKTLGKSLEDLQKNPDYKKALFRCKWDYLSMQWTRLAWYYGVRTFVPREGRLKSLMTYLIGQQIDACNNYVKKPYFQNRFNDENGNTYTNKEEPTYEEPALVPQKYSRSTVVIDSKETLHTAPQSFFNFSALMGKLSNMGYDANTFKNTYQKMYVDNVLSYPRTADTKITTEQFYEALPYVDQLAELVGVDPHILTHRQPRRTHVTNDALDHGANRPSVANIPSSLSGLDAKYGEGAEDIYILLTRNFLATFAEDYEYEQQKGHVKDYPDFKGTANIATVLGWKAVSTDNSSTKIDGDDVDGSVGLGTYATPFIYEGANPKPHAPTTLWLMKQLEKYNTGTGATRVSIFAEMVDTRRKYPLVIESKKGKLDLTECGRISYALLPDTHIADLNLTESLMDQMEQVKNGADPDALLRQIRDLVADDAVVMKKNGEKYRMDNGIENKEQQYEKKEKFSGKWHGKDVEFNREWGLTMDGGKYRFSDEECEKLAKGEEIAVHGLKNSKGKYGATGKLAKQVYNGNVFIGFKPTGWLSD